MLKFFFFVSIRYEICFWANYNKVTVKAKIHDHFKMIILNDHIKMPVYFTKNNDLANPLSF